MVHTRADHDYAVDKAWNKYENIYIEDMKYLLPTYIWIIDCSKYIIDFWDYGVYIVKFDLRFINVKHDCRVSL